jgi:hypothetical protein
MLRAAREDIISGMEEEFNVVLPPVQPGFIDGLPQIQANNLVLRND